MGMETNNTQCKRWKNIKNTKRREGREREREERYEQCGFIAPVMSVCQVSVRLGRLLNVFWGVGWRQACLSRGLNDRLTRNPDSQINNSVRQMTGYNFVSVLYIKLS